MGYFLCYPALTRQPLSCQYSYPVNSSALARKTETPDSIPLSTFAIPILGLLRTTTKITQPIRNTERDWLQIIQLRLHICSLHPKPAW